MGVLYGVRVAFGVAFVCVTTDGLEVPKLERRRALRLVGAGGTAGVIGPGLTPNSEAASLDIFPGALKNRALDSKMNLVLSKRGYTATNTLYGHSTCPDEVNSGLVDTLAGRWGTGFALGGLGGIPFSGSTGLGAYAHHVPDAGRLLIVFAPHVGISEKGAIGKIERGGQTALSTACGASVGAYNALKNRAKAKAAAKLKVKSDAKTAIASVTPMNILKDPRSALPVSRKKKPKKKGLSEEDLEIDYIKRNLAPRLDKITLSKNDIGYVTYQMYAIAKEALIKQIEATPSIFDDCIELAVMGGVQINRKSGGDLFQPLMFQTIRKDGSSVDLYNAAFGPLPNIGPVIGSAVTAKAVFGRPLGKKSAQTVAA